jgi:hypothetical protein
MLLPMLKCCERKTLFIRRKILLKYCCGTGFFAFFCLFHVQARCLGAHLSYFAHIRLVDITKEEHRTETLLMSWCLDDDENTGACFPHFG